MDNKTQAVLTRIEKEEGVWERNEQDSIPKIAPIKSKFASVPRGTGKLLHILVLAKQAQNILEIGSSVGYSTLWLGSAAKQTRGQVHSLEVSSDRAKIAQQNIADAELTEVKHLNINALDYLKDYTGPPFDFIFVDSFKIDYPELLELSLSVLTTNGLVIFDNILSHYDNLESFVTQTRKRDNLTTELLPLDNGLLVICKQ